MKLFCFFAIVVILLVGFSPVFAEPQTQTQHTDKGSLDVRLSYEEIIPGQLTTLNIDFLKPNSQEIQPHIDWTFSVSKDGDVIWGPTQLSHTSEGSLKNLRYEFDEKGTYNLEFNIEGILFQIIPTEKADFEVVVGEPQSIPKVSIDAYTSKNFYEHGESVGVSGKIKNYDPKIHSDILLKYNVLNPSGESVSFGQATPSESGSFSLSVVASGNGFEQGGDYSIKLTFGSAETEIPLYLSGGEDKIEDKTPPRFTQHEDIKVIAQTSNGVTPVEFSVIVTDDVDKQIKASCKPESGYLFGIGETVIKCTAKDSAGNFALPMSFSVIVSPPEISIPNWVKNVAGFWCQDQIDDASFIQGIQYLIDNGIIRVPGESQGQNKTQDIPQWVKNNACWWSEGSITDMDFASGIQFLVREGIIVV